MVRVTWTLNQSLLRGGYLPITVIELDISDLTDNTPEDILDLSDEYTGLAVSQDEDGITTHIAFATRMREVLCIRLSSAVTVASGNATQMRVRGIRVLQRMLLHNEQQKLAFDMHTLALALFHDHELTVKRAVDLQSSVLTIDRRSVAALMLLFGGETNADKDDIHKLFKSDLDASRIGVTRRLALRAWATRRVATLSPEMLQSVKLINTHATPLQDLKWLAKITRVAWCLHALKSTRTENDVSASFTTMESGNGQLGIQQTRFKTRLRKSDNQILEVRYGRSEDSAQVSKGRTTRVNGKSAVISVAHRIKETDQILGIVTNGRDSPTAAEKEREAVVLEILQGDTSFFSLPLVQQILRDSGPYPTPNLIAPIAGVDLAGRTLNNSQATAVCRITSVDPNDQLVLVHGPPGTGKTTVIAASVIKLVNARQSSGIWLIAQSNIAVKNIAEKLADVDFFDFKILVSADFHFEWHEHLYGKIQQNVICSDEFSEDTAGTSRLLLDSKVILCTISMLSTPRLVIAGFTRIVPVETVIVDEASQIELGGYVPMLARFGGGIKKLVFIGDDKQLAPYGQEDLGDLASIFEQQHLRNDAVFLDTQYRMPKPIGAFISKHVYSGRLNTTHKETSRQSCILVDVSRGQEVKSGNSWTNTAEADIVIAVARKFNAEGKKYKIITPYDAQRTLLEKRLGTAKLPWEDICYNVDSFQGNEEDYIIISVVRTDKPGFLTNMRRTNVMLSRCKCGMVVCARREFLDTKAKSSLMGKLASEWSDSWVSWRDALQGNLVVTNARASGMKVFS